MTQISLPTSPVPHPRGVTETDRLSGAILDIGEKLVNAAVPGLGDAIHDARKALGPQHDSSILGALIGGATGGLPGAVRGFEIGKRY